MRSSIQTYLVQAKRHLQKARANQQHTRFVIGNEAADLDSIASALVYGYIESSRSRDLSQDGLVIPVTNIPANDLSLRPELTALLRHANLEPRHLITLDDIRSATLEPKRTSWVLVDHNSITGPLRDLVLSRVQGVIDHHDDEGHIPSNADPKVVLKSGSCCSLVANHIRPVWDEVRARASSIGAAIAQDDSRLLDDTAYTSTWTAHAAKLALGPILIDTNNMTDDNKVTDHDKKAARYLEALINIAPRVGKDFDRDAFFDELNKAKNDIDDLSIRDVLRKDYKEWSDGELRLGTAVVVQPIEYLRQKDKNLPKEIQAFAASRKVQLMAVMTAYEDKTGEFGRELALVSIADEAAVDAAKRFASSSTEELQLEKSKEQFDDTPGIFWSCIWRQRNLSASRKRTAPLLREALKV